MINRRFNVDLKFLFGTIWAYDRPERGGTFVSVIVRNQEFEDTRLPAWSAGYTDWDRRAITLPTVSKSYDSWTGNTEVGQVSVQIADTDGNAFAQLYAGTQPPFGKPVAVYSKVTENPQTWMPIFVGNITEFTREKGYIQLLLEDAIRGLYNSRFVADYAGIATRIGTSLYGTVLDIFGTNFRIEDKGELRFLKTDTETGGASFFQTVFGAAIGAAFGAFGGWTAVGIGALSGALANIPESSKTKTSYMYHMKDFNAIPDDTVLGGQRLKFTHGSVNGLASNTSGDLFNIVEHRNRGGTFAWGVYGTIEVDDLLSDVQRGDYVYSELPLMFHGSPDDIIVNMLTGRNVTQKYEYPRDFARDWLSESLPLRHMELYSQIDTGSDKSVMETIETIAAECGFRFFVDEENKFAVRSVRSMELSTLSVLGTLTEDYNIIGDGLSRTESVRDSYTDISIEYDDQFLGLFPKTVSIQTSATNWMTGMRNVKEIKSDWIHDAITAEFIAKRHSRRLGTSQSRVTGEVSLYAVPMEIGEVVSVTGWSVGTGRKYEVTSYSKDFGKSVTSFSGIDVEHLYATANYGLIGTRVSPSDAIQTWYGKCVFATVYCSQYSNFGSYGVTTESLSPSETQINMVFFDNGSVTPQALYGYIRTDNGDEVMRVVEVTESATVIGGLRAKVYHTKVERGAFDTLPDWHVSGYSVCLAGTPSVDWGYQTNRYYRWF